MNDSNLTRRELEIVRLLATGCTYTQIAARLGISVHTVACHLKNTYRKLEVHNAPAAVSRAFITGGIHED